jgi:Glycosyl transferase family group 2
MRFARDPVAAVTPVAGRVRGDEPITASTAILLCIRNEPPEPVARLLEPMLEGLAARAVGGRFHVYVLSDTSEPDIAAAEDTRFAALAATWQGRIALSYRRRASNIGFKAGNIGDFCRRWGKDHDFAVMLDADSVMTVDLVLKLVRIMQIDPRLGILQSLVIGMPSASAFARIFQFGMRLGMRSYTIGSAWWQGDCGPYWGHNAIVRIAPFMAHCDLPVLTEGALVKGHVLSHDQVEAVLMRRAGYQVRVLAEEGSSFEQNPPTLIEFIRRDLRWCLGNMQYWHFLHMPGLRPLSRYQLVFAILMFLGSPAWIGLLLIGTAAVALAPTPADFMRWDAGIADPCQAAPPVRRGAPVHRELHDHDHLRGAGRSDHVGEPHAVSDAPSARPHRRMGRAGTRRSRGTVVARLPAALAAHLDRARTPALARGRGAIGHSLCFVHRGRSAALDPARGGDRLARARARADRHRARPIAGGDVAAARIARAWTSCDRDVAARAVGRSCARPGTSLGGPSGASCVRSGSTMAIASATPL